MSPLARLSRRLPTRSVFSRSPTAFAIADCRLLNSNHHIVSGSFTDRRWSHTNNHQHQPHYNLTHDVADPIDSHRFYSSSSINYNNGHRGHHPPKNEHQRHKLNIGFASLSNSLPFESTSEDGSSSSSSSVGGGDTELELTPHATIMLTSLRGNVSNFDIPAPPSIESNKRLLSSAESTTCWSANRSSEVQIMRAFDQAWAVLLEEDDAEARHVFHGKEYDEDDNGSNGGSSGCCVTMTCRLGYRSAVVLSEEDVKDAKDKTKNNIDCQEREGKFSGDARVGVLFAGKPAEEGDGDNDSSSTGQAAVVLVHNLSKDYVLHSLRSSPLVQQYKLNKENNSGDGDDGTHRKNIELISLAHNPETQIAAYLLSNHNRTDNNNNSTSTLLQRAHDYMKQSLTSSFVGYEISVQEGLIDGYGVDSNGLSLPNSHDMHFGWRDVLECAADAYLEVHGDNDVAGGGGRSSLKTIRLPGNVLETRGLDVAREVHSYLKEGGAEEGLPSFTDDQSDALVRQKQKLRKLRNVLPESLDVCVTRPLTAYPYGGTGVGPNSTPGLAENGGGGTLVSTPPSFLNGQNGATSGISGSDGKNIDATHPIRILDYQIEAASASSFQEPALLWSNQHYNQHGLRPGAYQPILNAALSHFDADAILEASRERELTVEERETLDGCKLLRDMLHDLDASLDNMKSFAAYEEYLVNVAVPLIHGSFEELDEDSAGMLQLFFRVHGMAVRMVVARWTRDLLSAGWKRVGLLHKEEAKGVVRRKDKDQERVMAKVWKDLGFGEFAGGYEIDEDATLQEFALKHLLKEDAVRSLVVGCSRPEHVLEAMRAADSSDVGELK